METQANISPNLKARISACLFMAMVLFTVVPFNLFHDHDQERVAIQVNTNEDHNSCEHQFHIAEEQELCFLCHFAFLPSYKTESPVQVEDRFSSYSTDQNSGYRSNYSFVSVYSIQNKGSPLV